MTTSSGCGYLASSNYRMNVSLGDEAAEPADRFFVYPEPGARHRQSVWRRSFMLKVTTVSLLAASFALPVMAQTPSSVNHSNAALNAPATHDTAGNPTDNGYNWPSARNSAFIDNGDLRA